MASFVLVHGSGQNAASWAAVADLLRGRGHDVATPELPKRTSAASIEDYAGVIAAAVDAPETVVVAHSLCGVFLPVLPSVRTCGRLVFLAAVIPEPGTSVRAQFTADPSMFHPEWIRAGPRWFDPEQTEGLAREFLFHDCDDDTLRGALGTLSPMDTQRVVTQPCPLPSWPEVPCASIVAARDRTLHPEWIRRATRRRLGVEPIEVDAGHCPHVSRPVEIARILEHVARG